MYRFYVILMQIQFKVQFSDHPRIWHVRQKQTIKLSNFPNSIVIARNGHLFFGQALLFSVKIMRFVNFS